MELVFNLITSLHQGRLMPLNLLLILCCLIFRFYLQNYKHISKQKKKKKGETKFLSTTPKNPKQTTKPPRKTIKHIIWMRTSLQSITIPTRNRKFSHVDYARAGAPSSPNSITSVRPGSSDNLVLLLSGDNWASTAAE